MEFDNTFSVTAPIDEVWAAILDVERVAPRVPGARVIEQTGDNAYKVAIKVRLGPLSMTYTGTVQVVEQDDDAHRAVMRANATEARGQGIAEATVELRLTADGEQTRGTIHSDVAISGKAAAMGQGVIGDVSARIIDTFAQNLAAMLAGEGEPVAEGKPAPEAAPTAGAGGAAGPGVAAAAPPPPPPSAPPQEEESGLPVLAIAGSVLAGRMRDPRVLAGTLAAIAAVFFALGRRSAR
jgi:carbon monoxide dehydrogenase subunit G